MGAAGGGYSRAVEFHCTAHPDNREDPAPTMKLGLWETSNWLVTFRPEFPPSMSHPDTLNR